MIFQTSYPILGTKIRNIVQRKRILVLRSQIISGKISMIVSGDPDQGSVEIIIACAIIVLSLKGPRGGAGGKLSRASHSLRSCQSCQSQKKLASFPFH